MARRGWSVSSMASVALAAVLIGGPGPAVAQTVSPSNSSAISQPTAAAVQSESLDSQIAAWTDAPSDVADAGLANASAAPNGSRQIHGQAGAAVGSNGYRAGYVTAEIPVGSDSTLGLGVSQSQATFRGGQTIRHQSLDLSLMIGEPSGARPCSGARGPDGAADPLWASRMRDAAAMGGVGAACGAGPN